ncbi:MAG: hypothetical protein NWF05_10285 [Candidatus Bathyarchaeota archaeon]|nr:hypothetical protein [Candidatus Bathyarchaeota archaeon]
MRIKKAAIIVMIIAIALAASMSVVNAASTVGTYESDYTTTKVSYVQSETVYIKWNCTGYTSVSAILWRGTNFVTTWSGGATGTYSWATSESTPTGTYTVEIYETEGPKIANCEFNVVSNFVVPEYPLGALMAMIACFAAVAAIGVVGIRRTKTA